ncbi:hypothetical protein GF412_04110 [Candidatus Micrarchaeota archaeon]|nr:hypothetical protein [Candidatus Micrarchaeota archaeon]MBD3418134.1 hypothetical protein [Candidatus Micrarchaeota archaeon]
MAYKVKKSKEEAKLEKTVDTMRTLVKQPNAFQADHLMEPEMQQAREFSERYLSQMEDLLSGMRGLRHSYNDVEEQFSAAEAEMPDSWDRAAVMAGTGFAQGIGTLGSILTLGQIVTPKEVVVDLTKERAEFFQGMEKARLGLLGNPRGRTPAEKKGAIRVFREKYAKVYFAYNGMVGALLEGNYQLATKKAGELKDALAEFKKAHRNVQDALTVMNGYTSSMNGIKKRIRDMAGEMVMSVASGIAIGAAIGTAARGAGAFYRATSDAGKVLKAGSQIGVEAGTAGTGEYAIAAGTAGTFASEGAALAGSAERGIASARSAETGIVAAERGLAAEAQAGQAGSRAVRAAQRASDAVTIDDATHNESQDAANLAVPVLE